MSSEAPPQTAQKREVGAASPRAWHRLAPPPAGRVLAGVFVAVMATLPFVLGANWVNTLTRAWISSLAVFSINLLTGVAGLLSFGQAGFVGLGAYTYGVLAVAGVSPALAVGAALLLSTAVGFLLALPAARLKGSYLAIGTLGFGVLVAQLLNNMVDVTRGPMGLLAIPSFGRDRTAWYFAAMTASLLTMAGLRAARAADLSRRDPQIDQARRHRVERLRHRRLPDEAARLFAVGGAGRSVRRACMPHTHAI